MLNLFEHAKFCVVWSPTEAPLVLKIMAYAGVVGEGCIMLTRLRSRDWY